MFGKPKEIEIKESDESVLNSLVDILQLNDRRILENFFDTNLNNFLPKITEYSIITYEDAEKKVREIIARINYDKDILLPIENDPTITYERIFLVFRKVFAQIFDLVFIWKRGEYENLKTSEIQKAYFNALTPIEKTEIDNNPAKISLDTAFHNTTYDAILNVRNKKFNAMINALIQKHSSLIAMLSNKQETQTDLITTQFFKNLKRYRDTIRKPLLAKK